ncbi:MAG: twitching motility protein PilT [Methanomassiliicoccales archaeon]|nr:twitching motility protein PilT [Methanomassiliicoccales archaeon]
MQKVVLDTNALLMPFECSLNIDLELRRLIGECEVHVPSPVLGELKRSRNKYAKAALDLARKYMIDPTDQQGDDAIVELALKLNAFVVTNDKYLISKLSARGIRVIVLRSKNHLDFYAD